MKEQGPNQGADRLTNQANSLKLEREGDIFMAEGNGNGGPEHGAPKSPEAQSEQSNKPGRARTPKPSRSGAPKPDQPAPNPEPQLTPERIKEIENAWKEHLPSILDPDVRTTIKASIPDLARRGITPKMLESLAESTNDQPVTYESPEVVGKRASAWSEWAAERIEEGLPETEVLEFVKDQIAKGRMPVVEEKETVTEEQHQEARAQRERGMEGDLTLEKKGRLRELLTREDIKSELLKPNPNLSSDALKDLRDYFAQIDIARESGAELYMVSQVVAGLKTADHGGGDPANIQASEVSRRLMFEWAYEKLIGRPDLGSEEERYSVGSFQLLNLLDEMKALSIREFSGAAGGGQGFVNYLSQLGHVREVAHELNRTLNYGEQYKEYVLKELRAEGLDFMQNDMAGVASTLRIYEKAAAAKVAQTHKWLMDGDIKAIDEDVASTVEDLFRRGSLQKEGRILTDWEKQRALRIGRIFFAGTQRMAMYTALGDIPLSLPAASLKYEYIGRALMPFKMTAPRFFGAPGPKEYMKLINEEIGKRNQPGTGHEYIGLFGTSADTMMENASGAKDAESHSWRSQLMFLGNVKIGEKTLLQYLLDENVAIPPKNPDTDKDWVKTERKDEKKEYFSRQVEQAILGQRLYLSVLARHGDFDAGLKQKIWEKISLLKPSTMTSLLPETSYSERQIALVNKQREGNLTHNEELELKQLTRVTSETWNSLRKKLYIVEEERVAHDAARYSGRVSEDSLTAERRSFAKIASIAGVDRTWTAREWNSILRYAGMESLAGNLTPDETRLLKNVIKNGFRNARTLANAQIPFGFVIDDAPKIAWKKTGDGQAGMDPADLIRILVSDQQSYTEAWTEINGLVEFPTKDVIKHISTAVDKIGNVDGRVVAQDQLEPFIAAWMRMGEMKEWYQWVPGMITARHMLRKPTSIMEQYYRNEFISMDAGERAGFLMGLAQAKAIRDSLDKGDLVGVERNMTQLDKLRKETKSDRMSLFINSLRIMIMIFGPAFAMEFLKGVTPKELAG